MATKIEIDDMKFDIMAYSKQHNIIQIIKYLKGLIADTINSNADDIDDLTNKLKETEQLLDQLADLVSSLMGTMSDMLDDMMDIVSIMSGLRIRIENVEDETERQWTQIDSNQGAIMFAQGMIDGMRNMTSDYLNNTRQGQFLKSLGATPSN